MRASAAWIRDTPVLACLSGLGHTGGAPDAAPRPGRAGGDARQPAVDRRAALGGEVGEQRPRLRARVRLRFRRPARRTERRAEPRCRPSGGRCRPRCATSATGTAGRDADPRRRPRDPAAFAPDWIAAWLRDLERHILPAPPTPSRARDSHDRGCGAAHLAWQPSLADPRGRWRPRRGVAQRPPRVAGDRAARV